MNFAFRPLAKRYDTWKFDWERDCVANSDPFIFRNTFREIANVANTLDPQCIRFEHECYDAGHLYNLQSGIDTGLIRAPNIIQFVFEILGGIGPEVDKLVFMKRTAASCLNPQATIHVLYSFKCSGPEADAVQAKIAPGGQ